MIQNWNSCLSVIQVYVGPRGKADQGREGKQVKTVGQNRKR